MDAQNLIFNEPVKLSASVNSKQDELLPLLSEGNRLYFVRANSSSNAGGVFSRNQVWYSDIGSKDSTSRPFLPAGWRIKNSNAYSVIGFSDKGNTVFLLKNKPGRRVKGIYFSKNVAGEWIKPELIPIPGLESADFFSAYVSYDFEVILFSINQEGGYGKEDIYVSFKNAKGEWSKIRNLGSTINTAGFEMSPFLSPDKSTLFFSSEGHSSVGGSDIYYSERLYNSWETWSVPKKLPIPINSEAFDAYFAIYGDSVCYFSSDRQGGALNIYRSRISRGVQNAVDASKLIEETKALLSEIRGNQNNVRIRQFEVISLIKENEIRPTVDKIVRYLTANAKVYILYNNPVLPQRDIGKVTQLFLDSGVRPDGIETPGKEHPLYTSDFQGFQAAFQGLRSGEFLIVIVDQ